MIALRSQRGEEPSSVMQRRPDALVRDPIYKQLNDALRGLIAQGGLEVGAKFLSEREISERFSVSRATANKALSTLVAEGLLSFRKGVGTFVRARSRASDATAWPSFERLLGRTGAEVRVRVLGVELTGEAALERAVARRLELPAGDAVRRLERLYMLDGEPVALESSWVLAREGGTPELETVASPASSGEPDVALAALELEVAVVPLDERAAGLLVLGAGSAGLLLGWLGRSSSGRAVSYEQVLARGDRLSLHLDRRVDSDAIALTLALREHCSAES